MRRLDRINSESARKRSAATWVQNSNTSVLKRTRQKLRKLGRRGISAIEVVGLTAVGVPMAAAMFFLARAGCRAFLDMTSVVIGWPHL